MKRFLLIAFFAAGVFAASAQEKSQLAFRIGVLDYSGNIDSAWLAPANLEGVRVRKNKNPGGSTSKVAEGKLKLSRSNLSTSWLHANVIDGTLAFYESEPVPETDLPKLVALARFPGGGIPEMAYLLFVPSPGEDLPYRVVAMDAATSAFPPASHLVFNLIDSPVLGYFGEQRFQIAPGEKMVVSEITRTNPRGYFRVYFAHGKEPDWKRIAFTQWKLDPTAQRICLVYRSGNRVAIRTFNQFVGSIEAPEMPEDTRERVKGPEEVE